VAVKFMKKKIKLEKTAIKLGGLVVKESVDQYVDKLAEVLVVKANMQKLAKDLAQLEDIIQLEAVDHPLDETLVVEGNEHDVMVGKSGNSSKIVAEVDEMFDLLGEDLFKQVVSFGIGNVKKYCSQAQLEEIMVTERTGKRPVKVLK